MAAKLIGPNLEFQFFKKIHFLDEVIVFDHLPCKGLKENPCLMIFKKKILEDLVCTYIDLIY